MTRFFDIAHARDVTGPCRRSARLAAGCALAALFALGTPIGSAVAQPYHGDQHRDVRHFDHRDDHHFQGGGYYPAPPVVYGGPVYAAPPVVYGPAVGIYLPGVSIGIN